MSAVIRSRVAALVAPLAPAPCGSDARFDPEYEALRDEVKKLESPGAAGVDWAAVSKRGCALLTSTTKDIVVASYAAHALFECEGPAGLGAGLLLINELLEQHWDGLFPPLARMRARSSAIGWWVERSSARLQTAQGLTFDGELLALLASEGQRLGTLVRARFGDAAPAVGPLLQAIERAQLNAGPAASPQTAVPAGGNTPAGSTPTAEPAHTHAPAPAPEHAFSPSPASDVTSLITQRAAEWLTPISPEQPAGDDARYDDGYARVRDAIKRLDAPTGQPVDWAQVLRDGGALLRTRSKDLLIAAHVAYALYDQRGLDGLCTGLCLLQGLIAQYWDGLYPDLKRGARGRANALGWFTARMDAVGERVPTAAEQPLIADLTRLAAELERVVDERFADQRPALGPLTAALQRLALAAPPPAPAAPPTVEAKPAATPATPATPIAAPAVPPAAPAPAATAPAAVAAKLPGDLGPAPQVSNQYELDAFYRKLRAQLWELAHALRAVDDAEPLAYRFARIASYLTVVDAPALESSGVTSLPAPSPFLIGEVELLANEQSWQKALALAEQSLQKSPYLLDLQRHVHTSLQRLGPRYARALRAVEAELMSLLKRAPELGERKFDNGTPFADPATRDWLKRLAAAPGSGGATSGNGDQPDPEDRAALEAVRSAIAAGQTAEALEAFDTLFARLGSGRERFAARLALARAHAQAGAGEMAAAVFEGLVEELDRHRLDVWDPSLASECLASYYHCLKTLGQRDKEMAQAAGVVYRRLCRVDPKRALTEAPR